MKKEVLLSISYVVTFALVVFVLVTQPAPKTYEQSRCQQYNCQ